MRRLSPSNIAATYTIEQIREHITKYQNLLDAAASGDYGLDDGDARQNVRPPDPEQVAELFNAFTQALRIKNGVPRTRQFTIDYRPLPGRF